MTASDPTRTIAVVGNGGTAIDEDGRHYVNRHTAAFLLELATKHRRVSFIEPGIEFRVDADIKDQELPHSQVQSLAVSRARTKDWLRALVALWRADFVYIFFPGTLPRLVGRICGWFRIPYGLYLRGERFATNGTDARIFANAQLVCSVGGIGSRVQHLTPNVIPIRPMLDFDESDAVERTFVEEPQRTWRLLFVGRVEVAKGVNELIDAAEILHERGFRFDLTIVGGGAEFQTVAQRLLETPDLPVSLAGMLNGKDALLEAYDRADILLLPTHHEGFPRVLYEAMLRSLVVVTTFVGGISGVMKDADNCIRIPVGNPVAIADAVIRVAGDIPTMNRLAAAARRDVLSVLRSKPHHADALVRHLDERAFRPRIARLRAGQHS